MSMLSQVKLPSTASPAMENTGTTPIGGVPPNRSPLTRRTMSAAPLMEGFTPAAGGLLVPLPRGVTPTPTHIGPGFIYRSNQLAHSNMPIDLVLVRHGESEGNVVKERKDDTVWDGEFGARHTSKYRLTDRGRLQAKTAGKWLREHFVEGFDMCFSSEYIRAIETSACLELDQIWTLDRYLRERDNGIFSGRSNMQNQTQYVSEKKRRERDLFYYAPPAGESVAGACQRVEIFLNSLSSCASGLKVLAVVHRNIMEAFRIILENIPQTRFEEVFRQPGESDSMDNCTILHYSRKCPGTKEVSSHLNWVRSVLPWKGVDLGWREVVRPRFSNLELMQIVNAVPQLINNTAAEVHEMKEKEKANIARQSISI